MSAITGLPHFIFTTSEKVDNIAHKRGNFICVSDTSEFYVDFTSERKRLGSNRDIATQTTAGVVMILNNISQPSDIFGGGVIEDDTASQMVPTLNTIKNWDGSYNSKKSSNLLYNQYGKMGSASTLDLSKVMSEITIVGRTVTITYGDGTTKVSAVTDPGCDCNISSNVATVEDIQSMLSEAKLTASGVPITSTAGCSLATATTSDIEALVAGEEVETVQNTIAYSSCPLYHYTT